MNLTPAIPGESEPIFRQLTGFHVGFNWRDIDEVIWDHADPAARISLYPPAPPSTLLPDTPDARSVESFTYAHCGLNVKSAL